MIPFNPVAGIWHAIWTSFGFVPTPIRGFTIAGAGVLLLIIIGSMSEDATQSREENRDEFEIALERAHLGASVLGRIGVWVLSRLWSLFGIVGLHAVSVIGKLWSNREKIVDVDGSIIQVGSIVRIDGIRISLAAILAALVGLALKFGLANILGPLPLPW